LKLSMKIYIVDICTVLTMNSGPRSKTGKTLYGPVNFSFFI
jgi:hypothetical protein